MKLESLEGGPDAGPMILLYGGGPDEVSLLRSAMRTLSAGVGRQVALNDLPFVQSVDKCRLRAISAAADFGIVARAPADFEWTLGLESWLQVDEQLAPFCDQTSGVLFQYLNPGSGPEIIYSTAREW